MTQHIFVIGLDDVNRATFEAMPAADDYVFHQLLTTTQLQEGTVSIPELLEEAQRQLDAFDGSIDAIVGYWDFPVVTLVPILCHRYGLRSADLDAVVKCEHKYWSRLEQQKVIDEYPAFGLVDVDDPQAVLPDGVSYPAWVKPVESTSSEGAHRVEDDEQLRAALAEERTAVERLGRPFGEILEMMDLPADIAEIGGSAYMAEEAVDGRQATVEGFVRGGRVHAYGIVDSINYPDAPSFLRYQYPSTLPADVRSRMVDVSRRVIEGVGLDESTFNIEYFWDPASGRLNLLEVNARHSQSHAPLFERVDGVPNHAAMFDLALDRDPRMPQGEGEFATAAKWFLRRFSDGVVRRVPTPEEVAAIEEEIPGLAVQVTVAAGDRLSERTGEDAYSYVLAQLFMGARDEEELQRHYERCLEALPFDIEDRDEGD